MTLDRRSFVTLPIAAAALSTVADVAWAASMGPSASIRLWPGEAPGLMNPALKDNVIERSTDPTLHDRAMDHIRTPRIDVFRPARPNGAAVLIAPGGGYQRVVQDKEGYEVANWLTERGITAFVLFYRLPGDGWRDRANVPLADAQRAMRLIRSRAAEFGVDPKRVAAMGFSAGGHLCADLTTRYGRQVYAPVDTADTLDARPMLSAPIYPVVSMDRAIAHRGSRDTLLGADPTNETVAEHSPDKQVTAQAPPCFLVHAEDDKTVPVANSLIFRDALKTAGVPVETHLFDKGGHGFGWGRNTVGKPVHLWPDLWLAWAKGQGLLG